MAAKATKQRNSDVSAHVGKLSRSALYSKKGLYKRKYDTPAPAAEPAPAKKAPAYYPAEDVAVPKKSRKTLRPTRLRSTIAPGTVLILLAGRFRGKRVVFLKQLASGLLLVTGPFKINGVPLRRVNQAYVIATSTKVELGSIEIDAKVDDAYFSKAKPSKSHGTESEFFKDGAETKKPLPESRSADQKTVDKAVLTAVAATPNLAKYLAATFGFSKGQYPHLMKF